MVDVEAPSVATRTRSSSLPNGRMVSSNTGGGSCSGFTGHASRATAHRSNGYQSHTAAVKSSTHATNKTAPRQGNGSRKHALDESTATASGADASSDRDTSSGAGGSKKQKQQNKKKAAAQTIGSALTAAQ